MNGKRRIAVLFLLFGTLLVSLVLSAQASASPVSDKKARLREVQAKLQVVYRQADIAVEKFDQASSQLTAVPQQIKQNAHSLKVTEYNLSIANQQLSGARSEHLQGARCGRRRRAVLVEQLRRPGHPARRHAAARQQRRRHGQSIAAYQQDIKDRRITLNADKTEATKLVRARATQKNHVLGLKSKLEHMTAGLKSEIPRRAGSRRGREGPRGSRRQRGQRRWLRRRNVPDPGGTGRSAVVAIAKRYLGVPYVYGGDSPSGFDCSGLALYCYAQIGVSIRPPPRRSSRRARRCPSTPCSPAISSSTATRASATTWLSTWAAALHRGAAHRRGRALRERRQRLDRRAFLEVAHSSLRGGSRHREPPLRLEYFSIRKPELQRAHAGFWLRAKGTDTSEGHDRQTTLGARPYAVRLRPLPRLRDGGGSLPHLPEEGPPQGGAGQAAGGVHPAEIATEKYDQATSQLDTVNAQIAENERLLGVAQSNLNMANDELKAHAQDIYKARDVGIVDVLFSANSFDDRGGLELDMDAAARQQRRQHRSCHLRLPAEHQGPSYGARRSARRPPPSLLAECAAQKSPILGYEAKLKKMTKGLQKEIKQMQAEEALRAKLALQGYSGPIPQVDPQQPRPPRRCVGHRPTVPWRALRLGRREPERLRLLRPHDVLLRADRHPASTTAPPCSSAPLSRSRFPRCDPATSSSSATAASAITSPSSSAARPTSRRRTPATWCATAPTPGETPGSPAGSKTGRAGRVPILPGG